MLEHHIKQFPSLYIGRINESNFSEPFTESSWKPWWAITGHIECLSYGEAADLLQLLCGVVVGKVTFTRNQVKIAIDNISYICRPAYESRFDWSDDHSVDAIIVESYQYNKLMKKSTYDLSKIASITHILLTSRI